MPNNLKNKITIKINFVNIERLINTDEVMVKQLSIELYLFQNVKRSYHTSG